MNLSDLIEALEDLRDELGDDAEVRLAMQPSYPLAFYLRKVTGEETRGEAPRVWLAASGENCSDYPYAPNAAWLGGMIEQHCEGCDEPECDCVCESAVQA